MPEIFNSDGEYVGYLGKDGTIHDTRKGGLGGTTMTAGARMASRNPAERHRKPFIKA